MHSVLQTFINYMRYLTSFTVECSENITSDKKEEKKKSLRRKKKEYIEINFAESADGHAIIPSGLICV